MTENNKLWEEITPEEVERKRLNKDDVQFIDVREVEEYKEGRIPGAKLVPLGTLDVRHMDIDRNKEAIIICRSGGRSTKACEYLVSQGFNNLKNMTGGMLNWQGEIEK